MATQIPNQNRCRICGNLLDLEDHFCSNCGTEAPDSGPPSPPQQQVSVYSFRCNDCGASMSYDASAQSLRCPFCGSVLMTHKQDTRVLRPEGLVPFAVARKAAEELTRTWMHEGFWRPSDIRQQAMLETIVPVYVPYWVFSALTQTHWTADSSNVPWGARGTWCPVSGNHSSDYSGLLVGASAALTATETAAISPYDLRKAVAPETMDLTNWRVEEFQMPRRLARPLATGSLQELERQACRPYVPGDCRNLQVNIRILNMQSRPILLPVWVMAFRYKRHLYRVLINGQTGKLTGTAPFAYGKLATIIGIALAILLVIFFLAFLKGSFR